MDLTQIAFSPVLGANDPDPVGIRNGEASQRSHGAITMALDDWDVYSRATQAYKIGLIVAQAF